MQKDLGALIIGYQRLAGIQKNIDLCIQNGITSVYVSLDYPKVHEPTYLRRHKTIVQFLQQMSLDKRISLSYRLAHENVGAAVNVITACDWFFESYEFGVILEDDCIPSDSFFDFVRKSQSDFEPNENIWLISGTQFVPKEIIASDRVLLRYPQIWGWATTKSKWNEIRRIYSSDKEISWPSSIRLSERAYWSGGEIRARKGHLDAWDIILAATMLKRGKFALASNCNLVTNIGVDAVSTHTKRDSAWISFPTSDFEDFRCEIRIDDESSAWLKKYFYGIRVRHLFTTKLTRIFDAVRVKSEKPKPLILRLSPVYTYYSGPIDFL